MPNKQLTRRRFLKTSALATVGVAAIPSFGFWSHKGTALKLVLDPEDAIASAPTARWALSQLQQALENKGVSTQIVKRLTDVSSGERCLLICGAERKDARAILAAQKASTPSQSEALALVQSKLENRLVLLASGRASRGLTYALLDLADRVKFGGDPQVALAIQKPVIEQPANKVRSIYRAFSSEVEDKPWYNDREMWKEYLTMLATQRFNRFSLTFGMGYNTPNHITDSYFMFTYPFLFAVPGYDVRMGNLPEAERDSNFAMLKFISEETVARGIDFQLGLWSHGKDWPESPNVNYPLLGVTEQNHAPYCRDALTALLKACPAISGVTLRVHSESGVPDSATGFWETFFDAFRNCGRTVEIDMHAKNVTHEMIDTATSTGMPVTLSPKYWGELQGMGYLPASIQRREMGNFEYVEQPTGVGLTSRRFTRYSYGDYFREDRSFKVLHRVWPGTQHLLLSGDPGLASEYGRVSGFCDGLGFELHDPLTFKGRRGSGHPGGRCAYSDASLNPKYDWEKFLYTYRTWGRLSYNPDSDPDVWRRFLHAEFGKASDAVEKLLSSASQVLPLFTTAHTPNIDCSVYWPEVYTSMPIVGPKRAGPFQNTEVAKVFGTVSPLDPQLFSRVDEYVDALMDGTPLMKYTPVEVAQRLEDLTSDASKNLSRAAELVSDKKSVAFLRMAADAKIQIGLGKFFASKMRTAVLWSIYEETGDVKSLTEAIAKYHQAKDVWEKMAKEAKSVYVTDISFGDRPSLRGDWLDRLSAINADLDAMERRLVENAGNAAPGDPAMTQRAIREALSHPKRHMVACNHEAIESFDPGVAVDIEIKVPDGVQRAELYYRRVNQALQWEKIPMEKKGEVHQAAIPAEYTRTSFPLQYYFGLVTQKGPVIYPGLSEQFMKQPYYVIRSKRKTI